MNNLRVLSFLRFDSLIFIGQFKCQFRQLSIQRSLHRGHVFCQFGRQGSWSEYNWCWGLDRSPPWSVPDQSCPIIFSRASFPCCWKSRVVISSRATFPCCRKNWPSIRRADSKLHYTAKSEKNPRHPSGWTWQIQMRCQATPTFLLDGRTRNL